MKLSCIAIDDEPLALSLMKGYIGQVPELELVGLFNDSLKAARFLEKNFVQVVLVDINMPDMNGLELVKSLACKPVVIFTTAYKKFASEGFDLDAVDYLLKPIEFERFSRAIHKAVTYLKAERGVTGPDDNAIFVRSEYKLVQVLLDEIDYIEGLEDYIRIHLDNKRPLLTLSTMKAILEKLQCRFARVHRSYIVPVSRIRSIGNKKLVLASGKELPVSDTYYEPLLKRVSL